MTFPPLAPLKAGDAIAVVSPSGAVDSDALDVGLAWCATRYRVSVGASARERAGFLAGADDARAADVTTAITDRTVRAVVAARGGYGATRLLDGHADRWVATLRDDPKPLVGFSDITALHAVWSRAGVRSVHGTMVLGLGRCGGDDELVAVLEGAVPAPWTGLQAWSAGTVTGVAAGGNLALLAALVGTPWQLDLRGRVLFVEEVGEAPYRVDRMLTTLRSSGALDGVVGVVSGGFVRCEPGRDGVTVEEVLRERLGSLGVPVLAGAPFGHGTVHRPWVQGARVTLRGDGTVVFEEGLA